MSAIKITAGDTATIMMKIFKFETDFECNQESFWEWANGPDGPQILKDNDTFFLDDDSAEQLTKKLEAAPGWDDMSSPDFAQNPVMIDFLEFSDNLGENEFGEVSDIIKKIRKEKEYLMNDDDKIVVYKPSDIEFWEEKKDFELDGKILCVGVEGDYLFFEKTPTEDEVKKFFPD